MLQPRFRAALLDANFEVADPRAAKPEEVVRRPLADLKGTPFLREDPGELHRRSKLPGLIGIRHDCGNADHRFHRLAGEIHYSGMRLAKDAAASSGASRNTMSVFRTPQNMRPLTMNASPPNIFFSENSPAVFRIDRMRSARWTSYATII